MPNAIRTEFVNEDRPNQKLVREVFTKLIAGFSETRILLVGVGSCLPSKKMFQKKFRQKLDPGEQSVSFSSRTSF